MAGYDFDDLIKQVEATRSDRLPNEPSRAKLSRILGAVSGYMKALADSGHARNFEEFVKPGMIGCSCELDTKSTVVAHCFFLPDQREAAIIRVGRGKDRRTIDTSRMVEGKYTECGPDDDWKGHFRRVLEFITKEASEPIPD